MCVSGGKVVSFAYWGLMWVVGSDLDIEGKEEPSNRFWWDCCNLVEVFFIRLVPLVGSPSGVFCILVLIS